MILGHGNEVGDLLPTRRLEFGADLAPGPLLTDSLHRKATPVFVNPGRVDDGGPMNALVDLSRIQFHERPDGAGYYGRWNDVPRTAKALAVAEVLDAMVNSQVGLVMPEVKALEMLLEMRGVALDADCVDALASKLKPRTRSIPLSH